MSAVKSVGEVHGEMFEEGEVFARKLDAEDELRGFREKFLIPLGEDGEPCAYMCGNSLGLQPRRAREMVMEELEDWAQLGVEGHFEGKRPWYSYHEMFRESGARLVGGKPGEVVMMNSLTVNLHLLMMSFYRPEDARKEGSGTEGGRVKVLMEEPTFPSDTYAMQSHLRARGVNPDEHLIVMKPREGEHCMREEDVEAMLEREGKSIAVVMMAGVNFLTGQVVDMARVTRAAHKAGAMMGWDLAHAAGNIPMKLHEWEVDFAAWCSYKYLNSGPGAVAGVFVHEKHGKRTDMPRFAGWWGNDPATRFKMQLIEQFHAREGADGWQVSNPPIFSLTPVKASLDLFDEAGMVRLRKKSVKLTGYLRWLLERGVKGGAMEIVTPREEKAQGCQLSLMMKARGREIHKAMTKAGVVSDFREPNVIRVAPVPMYNSFHDAWRCAEAVKRAMT